jgi:RNA polymerase sigma factor (sigma-70 family)
VTADSSLLDRIGRRFLAAEPDVEEMNQLLECVKKLPEKARSVLEWRFMDDTQCDEIAARCGRSVQSVYAQIKRAKEMLRECVKTSAMSWSGTE